MSTRRTVLVAVMAAVGGLALLLTLVLLRDDAGDDAGDGGGSTASGRAALDGFGEVAVMVAAPGSDDDPVEYCLLLAETPSQRQQGLMGVTDPDLGGYDGMLFRFGEITQVGFWMKGTPMPLTVAYIGEDGDLVSTADMEPCVGAAGAAGNCPGYPPEGPYRWAVEVPQGRLADIGLVPGATFTDTGRECS